MKRILHTSIHWQITIAILFSILFSAITADAQNAGNEAARKYVADFFNARQQKTPGLKSAVSLADLTQTYQSAEHVKTPLYVFQQEGNGFAMVAQSGNNFAIVGYSDEAVFTSENIPPQLEALMNFYEDSLQFYTNSSKSFYPGTPVVPALLDEQNIRLDQFRHPEVGGSYTGCMATAITQILLFHAAEKGTTIKGYGSHCYNYGTYGDICANFENATYNSAELLSYHVAIALDMRFTTGGSSPPSVDKIYNIEKYFRFFVKGTISEDFYIKNELEHRRPVYSSLIGWPENHAVVVDGYDDKGYFHLNFGWGGTFNGYFLMNNGTWFGTGNAGQKFHSNFLSVYLLTPSQMPVNTQDSLALVAVHNALGGYDATQWDITSPVWNWPGVLVMNDRVIRLAVNAEIKPVNAQSIAPEIGNLTALQELSITGCLNGNIPSTITNLKELKELHIANSAVYINPTLLKGNFKSNLPTDINKLTNLEWLSLHNALKGTIPSSIGSLTKLKLLHISQDTLNFGKGDLYGTIPSTIGNLSNLQTLNITDQQLSGTFPESIKNLQELRDLNLSGNNLQGILPVLNFPQLTYLKLNDNQFTEIADGDGNCPNLVDIQLQNNKITGSIPSYIGNFTALKSINFSDNHIESLPEEIGNLTLLETVRLDSNKLTALPDAIALPLRLMHLSAANNQIGYIPSNFAQSRRLVTLNLANNQITSIPEQIGNCSDLYEIHLNNNKIKSIPETFENISNFAVVYLHNNEIQGPIPEKLMTSYGNNKFVTLNGNRFVFNDIPESDELKFGVRDQKNIPLQKQVYKVQMGDTVTIDIRSISNLLHPGNEYFWLTYPDLVPVITKDERFSGIENNPVLEVIIDENTIQDKYYCKVFNSLAPYFEFDYNGTNYAAPCMEYLNTDTIVFQLATEEEIIAEKYTKEFVTSQSAISDNTISDGTITLVPPLKSVRGEIIWEASADGINWERVSETMQQADLKVNLKSVNSEQLVLTPKNTAFYRCGVLETDCDPLFSEPLKVEAPGNILFDEIINVTEESRTISVDSIEVIVPQHFYDTDFRLTITKIENPPPSSNIFVSGSVYDVSVSFSDTFNIPLIIKLKNVDKTKVNENEINRFEAVYFDDKKREWIPFESAHLSLKDSTINIVTHHLTKMKWWWYSSEYTMGYTDVYDRNNVLVFYNDDHANVMDLVYGLKQSTKPWHISGTPKMVQDITEYLPMVIKKYKSFGLESPGGKFKVYMHNFKGEADGEIGVLGMMNGYIIISRDIVNPVILQQALAHEFMHYTQDYYISANGGNLFWMEAHATLSDRIIWDTLEIPVAESEVFLKTGKKSDKFPFATFLSNSWDYWDNSVLTSKMSGVREYGYLAGTFLHYMRSYREGNKKLSPTTLLKETSWFGSWRTYLASYTSNHLDAILGDEYEEYVKFLLSGKEEKFTLINKKGNPYAFLQDPKNKNVFTYPVSYRFNQGDEMVKKDEMEIEVPYMASKIVLLENMNPDTMVLVNYKRKHEFDYDHMVYHVTFDAKKQEMEFVDISDSTEYNFLLDANNDENQLKKFNNYSFLLLINKEYIGASSLIEDFDASFELTAMPVFNIENVGMLNINSGSNIVNHIFKPSAPNSSTVSEEIIIGTPNAGFLNMVLEDFSVSWIHDYTNKKVVNDQTYQIETRYTLVMDQGLVKGMPTMKDSTIYTQTIEHNVITGGLKITEHEEKIHKMHAYISFVQGIYDVEEKLISPEYTDMKEVKSKTYWLKDFMNYLQPPDVTASYEQSHGKNIALFETANTSQTRDLVSKIDATYLKQTFNMHGELISEQNMEYVSTNYSDPNLIIRLIIRLSDE
ncbi:MAG: C10 family peptidase [Prolixibacteraceae bacterium]|nr:C10 family peptidase [Prolixibacteraceae bacterium]